MREFVKFDSYETEAPGEMRAFFLLNYSSYSNCCEIGSLSVANNNKCKDQWLLEHHYPLLMVEKHVINETCFFPL